MASAVRANGDVVFFGGQDSEKGVMYNDLYSYNSTANQFTHHEYKDGKIAPAPRNSQTLSQAGNLAYLFAGANEEGPRRDLFKLDLETLEFSNIALKVPKSVKMANLEMHSAHVYQGNKLLVVGGRGYYPGESIE